MAKKKIKVELYSYGEYEQWDRNNNDIPKLIDITETIKCKIGTEFGYVLKINGAKGKILDYRIDHPSFKDESGKVAPPFTGTIRIYKNYYEFFLGDSIWEPIEDKMGNWILTTWIDNEIVARKTLRMVIK